MIDPRLQTFEPPRLFEPFLRGRDARETPDLTARICEICPVAHQISAVHAFERLYGVAIDPSVRALRRLYYCGEWIESQACISTCSPPDFFGFENIITVAPYLNALHTKIKDPGPYFLGPLARINLNFERLDADVISAARDTRIPWPNSNPYTSSSPERWRSCTRSGKRRG